MKFSELWLREYVDINLVNVEALLNQITMAGLEVENIKPVADTFNGIIIGKVVEYNRHYKVDDLRVIKVDIGDKFLLDIVCDASSCRLGMKVAVATRGAVLPKNRKIKIEKSHGKSSEGMLCSYFDLGICDDYDGIIELPEDAPIGADIRSYLKLYDNIIEVNITPNRADCLSIIGIAREIAMINKTKFKMPYIFSVENTVSDNLSIQVDAIDACPRYLGRVIKDINLKALTPFWMKERLRRCGTRSIDVIVDITNYILLELGQPIHIFDKDRIYGGIVVRMAKEGETLILLNGNEAKLNADTLVIADYDKVLAIGGIFDGKYSSINDNTQNILLGCAFFNPLFITGRARRYGLCTDISHRYELGVDPTLQYKAIERATKLLIDICGGKVGPIIDITNESTLPKHSAIILRRSKLDRLIGHHINDLQINDILSRLGCNYFTEGQNKWQVIAPSWRFDIEIEEDLVEEVARVYGYNNIPNRPVKANLVISSPNKSYLSLKRVKTLLNDKGYQEAITYSFVDPKMQQLILPNEEALIITNPISSEMSVMRLSLWTGLLRTIIYNQNRQQSRIRIFETGMCFIPDTQADMGVRQELMLACAIYGNLYEEHWDITKKNVDFYDIKGDLESVLDLTGKLSEIEFRVKVIPALHPNQSAALYLKDECIGFIGVLHPKLERKLNLKCRTILFELKWNKIADRVLSKIQYVSRFPAKRYDIAIVVADNIPAADILAECKKISINQVVNVNLFDVYRGKGIAEGFKSLAISIIFQDNNRTLKEKDIAIAINKCVNKLKERFQASLRDETYGAYKS